MTFRGWPVGRVLAGLTAAGFTTLIITRNLQTSSRMSLNASQQPAASTAFWRAGPSLLRLRLHSSEQVSPTTKRLRFELPTPDTISGPGLCCESVLLEVSYHLPKLVRYMSNTIADSCSCRPGRRMAKGQPLPHLKAVYPDEPGYLDLTVKQYSGGKMSTHLHSLSPGDTILFAAVIPTYRWTPNKHENITLIAGCAGITPLYQLAQGILNNPDDTKTKINLIYGVNEDSEILFRDQFDQWRHQFPDRFKPPLSLATQSPGPLIKKAGSMLTCLGNRRGGILQQIGFTKCQVFQF
ncbi:NADH-cytochrome b-5 reductase [Microsporum canis CBS 113480]|uniref:NADH-cytochrome b-5 reductase n=1 Tax=Arthroderma otae (strain ATCC MYA-4605 / CBS 113480) TaxID=554155 RepID=C5FGF1_ARTOC|nr:NADH-cytochrome b-5 reductase [Microsporum canis CBS 113480]EEQ29836.1 NADH-cytochrome b-5 reductase [Microsporum canis CBS 113480]